MKKQEELQTELPQEEIPLTLKKLEEEKTDKVPWSKLIKLTLTPKDIEKKLHEFELFTYEDVATKPNLVISALQSAYAIDLSAIREIARQHQNSLTE
jgi:hypothetical protein